MPKYINDVGEEISLSLLGAQLVFQFAHSRGWQPAGTSPPPDWRGDGHRGSYTAASIIGADDVAALRAALLRGWGDALAWARRPASDAVLGNDDGLVRTVYDPRRDRRLRADPDSNLDDPLTVLEAAFTRRLGGDWNPGIAALVQMLALLAVPGPVTVVAKRYDISEAYYVAPTGRPLMIRVRMLQGVVAGRGKRWDQGATYTLEADVAAELVGRGTAEWLDVPEPVVAGAT